MTTRKTYLAIMRLQLDELNNEMARLESDAETSDPDMREQYKDEMAQLRLHSSCALAKFEELVAASDEHWEGRVAEMEKARDAFSHSFRHFKSKFWILSHCPRPPELRLGVVNFKRWDRRSA